MVDDGFSGKFSIQRLPTAESYLAEDVIHRIVDAELPCETTTEPCARCNVHRDFVVPRIGQPPIPACDNLRQSRLDAVQYFSGQIYRAVRIGLFQLWSEGITRASHPKSLCDLGKPILDRDIQRWVEIAYFLKSDLDVFCRWERLQICFAGDPSSIPEQSTKDNRNVSPKSPEGNNRQSMGDSLALSFSKIEEQKKNAERPADTSARIKKRRIDLKKNDIKNFIKVIGKEEKLSDSGVKYWLYWKDKETGNK